MLSLSARNQHDLLRQLKQIDISVPPINQGRTTEHCERSSICRLLATLIKHQSLEFPIEVMRIERPDFCLHSGKKEIGIEFTEAIQPDFARARVLPEADSDESIIDRSLFKWDASKKSLSELRSIASETKLTGPGWEGDEIEIEWSEAIFDTTQKKTQKLVLNGFTRFYENWLSIYDNLNSFALDIDKSCYLLADHLHGYWTNDSFDKIYVESGDLIVEISKGKFTKLKLNDVWKNR